MDQSPEEVEPPHGNPDATIYNSTEWQPHPRLSDYTDLIFNPCLDAGIELSHRLDSLLTDLDVEKDDAARYRAALQEICESTYDAHVQGVATGALKLITAPCGTLPTKPTAEMIKAGQDAFNKEMRYVPPEAVLVRAYMDMFAAATLGAKKEAFLEWLKAQKNAKDRQ